MARSTLFSMLVLMANVAAMMASPLVDLFDGRRSRDSGDLATLPQDAPRTA